MMLLDLALLAADDPDACAPLGDYLLENDHELSAVQLGTVCKVTVGDNEDASQEYLEFIGFTAGRNNYLAANAASPTPTFARALAAVLLFGQWQQEKWRCAYQLRLYSNVRVFLDGVELREEHSAPFDVTFDES